MIESHNLCECMKKLIELNKVMQHIPPYTYLSEDTNAEDGQLCIANDIVEDLGYYDGYEWISNTRVYKELYPIKYCPVCGKKLEYNKYPSLTKKY